MVFVVFSLNLPKVTKIFRISVKSTNFEHEILWEYDLEQDKGIIYRTA